MRFRNVLAAAIAVSCTTATLSIAQVAPQFPPLGERYDRVPDDARSIVKSLQKLDAKIEIGISYLEYNSLVSDIYPEIKVFVSSAAARDLPELRMVLGNSIECYLAVRDLWRAEIDADGPAAKFDASIARLYRQNVIWKVASVNVAGAAALIDSLGDDLPKLQQSLSKDAESLTLASALRVAEDNRIRMERESRSQETGVPVPLPSPEIDALNLGELLAGPADFGPDVSVGDLVVVLPPIFSATPPASKEGRVTLLKDGASCGGVGGLLYDDLETARKSYSSLRKGFGDGTVYILSLIHI